MASSNPESALLAAFEEGSLGVSFGIAGFLIGYLAGAAYLLLELGIITPVTKVAGASSGALLAMGLCSGIPADRIMQITQQLCDSCRQQGNCQGGLGSAVGGSIVSILPPDAFQRCSGKAFMSITTGAFPPKSPVNKLVTDFCSNADLAAAGQASSYIPLWSGKAPTTTFRGSSSYDGFFSNSQPCPPGVKACIKINSRNPPWDNQKLDPFFAIFARVAHVGPLRPARLAKLPASVTQEATVAPGASSAGSASAAAAAAAALRKANELGVDIAPDIFSATRIAPQAWEELIVMPGDAQVNKYLWELGRRDAQIWARATGLEAAAAAKRAAYRMSQG